MHAHVAPVGHRAPRLDVVLQGDAQDLVDHPVAQPLVLDREHDLDPALEVARHPVGRRQVDLALAAVAEVEDARVLEEPIDDADDADVVAGARDARAAGSRCRAR